MSLEILGCPACAGTAIQAVNDENFDIAVSMGPFQWGPFQWGHNPTVMDTAELEMWGRVKMFQFQWGHNPTVMDTAYECLIS
jgi:hypothetical protein